MPDAIATEVTPAMLAAGAAAVKSQYGDNYSPEGMDKLLRSVYRAMRKAKLRLQDYPDPDAA